MKRFMDLVEAVRPQVREVFPWDLEEELKENPQILLLDVREPYEFSTLHIEGSTNVPRGIMEQACEYGYDETVPVLADAREEEIVVICRSGYRSVLAAYTLGLLGYQRVRSLKTGLRGWNDYELPLVDGYGEAVTTDEADLYFSPQTEQVV